MSELQIYDIQIHSKYSFEKKFDLKDKTSGHHKVIVFGRNEKKSICCVIEEMPLFLRIEILSDWIDNVSDIKKLLKDNGIYHIKKIYVEFKKKATGFYPDSKGNPRKYPFMNIVFESLSGFKRCIKLLKENRYIFLEELEYYGTNSDILKPYYHSPKQQFFISLDISPCDWISVDSIKHVNPKISKKEVEFFCPFSSVHKIKKDTIAPMSILFFDIETYSKSRNFPKSINPEDLIISTGMTFVRYGEPNISRKVCLCLKETAKSKECEIISCKTEYSLLSKFTELVLEEQVDIFTGYNNLNFDMRYMMDKAFLYNFFCSNNTKSFKYILDLWKQSVTSMEAYNNLKKTYDKIDHCSDQKMENLCNEYCRIFGVDLFLKNRFPNPPYREQLLSRYPNENSLRKAHRHFSKGRSFFYNLSYLRGETCKRIVKKVSSNAMGINESFLLTPMSGLITFDMWVFVKNNMKLKSYKLNSVCQELLGEKFSKVDLSYDQMFKEWDKNTTFSRRTIAEYCIQDCNLLFYLMKYLYLIERTTEMSRVTRTVISDIFLRGQQIKIWNQLSYEAEMDNQVLNVLTLVKKGKYKGATVIKSKPNYYSTPICTLDFKSLYPSIMISFNISTDTIVMDPRAQQKVNDLNIPVNKVKVGEVEYTYVKHFKGIIPKILDKLLETRYQTKKKMKQEKDPNKKKILDARQLAIKVSANSVYGFFGTYTGYYPFFPIPASTTSIGRGMIQTCVEQVEKKYDCEVIYGDTDSIMVKFEGLSGDLAGLRKSFDLGEEAADFLTNEVFKEYDPIVMEFEKSSLWYMIWAAKKRYISYTFEFRSQIENGKGKIDAKGIETVRRDNSRLLRILYKSLIDTMKDQERSLPLEEIAMKQYSIFKEYMEKLVQNKFPKEDYVITKSISKEKYKNNRMPHVSLFNKILKRVQTGDLTDPPPKIGDRLGYVIVEGRGLIYKKSETLAYAKKNNLNIDRVYYVKNQLMTPICKFCSYSLPKLSKEFEKYISELERQQLGQKKITNFFKRKIQET